MKMKHNISEPRGYRESGFKGEAFSYKYLHPKIRDSNCK
jgi:hypothetical protein